MRIPRRIRDRLYDRYVDGVIDFVNGVGPETGMTLSGAWQADLDEAQLQGWLDAELRVVIDRREFDAERLLLRIEARKSKAR